MPIRHALWKVAEQPVPLVESALVTEGLLEDMILAAPKRKFSNTGIVKHFRNKFLSFLPSGERKLASRLTKCVSEG
jgi:hypothetical protein